MRKKEIQPVFDGFSRKVGKLTPRNINFQKLRKNRDKNEKLKPDIISHQGKNSAHYFNTRTFHSIETIKKGNISRRFVEKKRIKKLATIALVFERIDLEDFGKYVDISRGDGRLHPINISKISKEDMLKLLKHFTGDNRIVVSEEIRQFEAAKNILIYS